MDGKCVPLRCKLYYTSYSYALVINVDDGKYTRNAINLRAAVHATVRCGGREEFDMESGTPRSRKPSKIITRRGEVVKSQFSHPAQTRLS